MSIEQVNFKCPCCSGLSYRQCCEIYHKGKRAKNAKILMQSRYCAFAICNINYIIKTSTFQKDFKELYDFAISCEFKALKIMDFTENSKEAYVTFKTTIFQNENDISFVEKSRFIKIDKQWMYESGEILE